MSRQTAFKEIKKIDIKSKLHLPYLVYRAKWNIAPRLMWVTTFPTHLDIESTNMCNLRCVMCPHGFPDEEYQREFRKSLGIMRPELFKKIIQEGVAKGLKSIKLNWRGEPLMAKSFVIDALKYAKEKGVLEVSLNTNGLLLDSGTSKSLILGGIDRVIFSIDGFTKNTYEKIRIGGNFETLVDNIKSFISIRNSLGVKTPFVRVQMVKMDENAGEVNDFIRMWRNTVDSISFQDYTNRGESGQRLADNSSHSGRLPCPQIWQRMVVAYDGQIIMCCRDVDSRNVLGRLDYDSGKGIEYFWKGENLTRIRELHKKRALSRVEACATCTYKESYNWKK